MPLVSLHVHAHMHTHENDIRVTYSLAPMEPLLGRVFGPPPLILPSFA